MNQMSASRHTVKTRVAKLRAPLETPIAFADVVRAVSGDETRSAVTRALRDAGFTADDFAHGKKARAIVPNALRIEDELELELWP